MKRYSWILLSTLGMAAGAIGAVNATGFCKDKKRYLADADFLHLAVAVEADFMFGAVDAIGGFRCQIPGGESELLPS